MKKILYMDSDENFFIEFNEEANKKLQEAGYEFTYWNEMMNINEELKNENIIICLVSEGFLPCISPEFSGRVVSFSDSLVRGNEKEVRTIKRSKKTNAIVTEIISFANQYADEEYRNAIATEVKNELIKRYEIGNCSDDELFERIRSCLIKKIAESEKQISDYDIMLLCRKVFNSMRGLGVLESIMEDEDVTEIMINGYDRIFVEKGGKLTRIEDRFANDEELMNTISRIVSKSGREINLANPIVDTRLEDGSRVHIVIPPIALDGPSMTIRRFPKNALTMDDLIVKDSITVEAAVFLERLVKAKYNIFISGGTGSGKTTFLNILSDYIPKNERVVTIEDSAELQIKGIENIVRCECRNANSVGEGSISSKDLLKSALRMRMDRIIVGEVRGEEALDMLQAMNTGHEGSLSTGHANTALDMLARIETMVSMGSSTLSSENIRSQIGSALDIIVHLSRLRDGSRHVTEITEVLGYKQGEFSLNPIYKFIENEEKSTEGKVEGRLQLTGNAFVNDYKLKLARC